MSHEKIKAAWLIIIYVYVLYIMNIDIRGRDYTWLYYRVMIIGIIVNHYK